MAATDYRNYIRETVLGFDGTTNETADYTQLRFTWTTPTTTRVGLFPPASLNRVAGDPSAPSIASVVRVMLQGTIGPTDEIRVVNSSGQTRFARPASLESSGWMFLGPEDVLAIQAPDATRADILVNDLTDEQLQLWIESEILQQLPNQPQLAQSSMTVTNTEVLPVFSDHLIVFVDPAAVSFDITLPPIAFVELDARITFVRVVGVGIAAEPRVVTDAALDEVNGLAGFVPTQYFLRAPQDSTTYTRIPGGWQRRQGDQAPAETIIAGNPINLSLSLVKSGRFHLLDAGVAVGNVTSMPPLADVPEGAGYLIRNTDTNLHVVDGDAAETINGVASRQHQRGEVMYLESAPAGWYAIGGGNQGVPVSSGAAINPTALELSGNTTPFLMSGALGQALNLPPVANVATGSALVIRNSSAFAHDIVPNGTDLIDGVNVTLVSAAGAKTLIISAGPTLGWMAIISA